MRKEKRSPLRDEPLRLPGQSIQEQQTDLLLDKVLFPMLIVGFALSAAIMEWAKYYWSQPPRPVLYTFIAIIAFAYAAVRIWRSVFRLRQLRQARDGERVVGQELDVLREQGFQILHDIVGEGFNVDHVLIGPAGVFTVETKTISKPAKGEAKVQFDGETVMVNGYRPDRDPVAQARAQASWIRGLISNRALRKVKVRPVVVYPGWYVERKKPANGDVWVLNPKALPAFIAREHACLKPEEIGLISASIRDYVENRQRAIRQ